MYLYVEAVDADAGRLTRDIDVIMRRGDLPRLIEGIGAFGLHHEIADGREMLVQTGAPSARRAVHLLFTGEKVRPHYPEAVPDLGEVREMRGVRVIPLLHLIRMKLTSFRAKDEAHLKDLDEAGLITADIESALSPVLRERLQQVRARE